MAREATSLAPRSDSTSMFSVSSIVRPLTIIRNAVRAASTAGSRKSPSQKPFFTFDSFAAIDRQECLQCLRSEVRRNNRHHVVHGKDMRTGIARSPGWVIARHTRVSLVVELETQRLALRIGHVRRRKAPILRLVVQKAQTDLLEVADALSRAHGLASSADSRASHVSGRQASATSPTYPIARRTVIQDLPPPTTRPPALPRREPPSRERKTSLCPLSESCYWAQTPPSTGSVWPVTYRASSESNHTTASAISSGWPIRPIGTNAA